MNTKIGAFGILAGYKSNASTGWPVSKPLRGTKTGPRLSAARGITFKNLSDERRINALIVGRVQLDLVHIHPHRRTLFVCGRPNQTPLRKRRRRCNRSCRAQYRAARYLLRKWLAING